MAKEKEGGLGLTPPAPRSPQHGLLPSGSLWRPGAGLSPLAVVALGARCSSRPCHQWFCPFRWCGGRWERRVAALRHPQHPVRCLQPYRPLSSPREGTWRTGCPEGRRAGGGGREDLCWEEVPGSQLKPAAYGEEPAWGGARRETRRAQTPHFRRAVGASPQGTHQHLQTREPVTPGGAGCGREGTVQAGGGRQALPWRRFQGLRPWGWSQ